ncbi:MAG: DUF1800 family protein [Granulosicoccus sp.]
MLTAIPSKLLYFVCLTVSLFPQAIGATLYSTAENGTDGWFVYDTTPAGAEVSDVFDTQRQSRVIETRGSGRSNGYRLGGVSAPDGWGNTSEFLLSWQMATTQPYVILVHVDTTVGARRLYYSQSNSDLLKNPGNNSIGFGLGSGSTNGSWIGYERNLRLDIETGEPGNQLLAVNGISVLGTLRIDDVTLISEGNQPIVDDPDLPYTVYSDGENGADGWSVFDNTPTGAAVTAVFDNSQNSRVIQTSGDGRNNRYLLGGTDATSGWRNSSEFILSWDMSTNEPFSIQVFLDTELGVRQLVYTKSNSDGLKNPSNDSISFGLGSGLIGNGWFSYTRDLAADVAIGEPGNALRAVNGIVVSGSFRLDNIRLGVTGDVPETVFPPTASIEARTLAGTAPLSVMFSAAESTAVAPATIAAYAWDFGNGNTAVSSGASTTYASAGSYNVSLLVTDSNGMTASADVTVVVGSEVEPPVVEPPVVEPPTYDADSEAAARLLAQATFGATMGDIEEVKRLGVQAWVDNQFSLQGTPHLEYAIEHPGSGSLSGPRQHKWLIDAIDGSDQLRQRVAFAYSQILVVSDVTQTLRRNQYAMANYYDILLDNAFANYRDLLEDVTLNPIMGIYLSMLQNGRGDLEANTRADQNYAREVMQLFTIGQYELNLDGSIRRDLNGVPFPAYTQADVEEYARVFTGWSYADANRFDNVPAGSNTNKFLPMQPYPGFHDPNAKTLLGGIVTPAGISPQQDLDNALDSLFNHPNVGPFVGKQLIQRLVTSNPTPAYVARVASAFNNNGSGVRGDMRAVIRAILLDTEARSGHLNVPDFGKLREPLLRWTHMWRAFNVQRGRQSTVNKYNHGSPYINQAASFMGQSPLSSPSVFNFFRPDYAPLGEIRDSDLVAPEAQIYTDAYILTTTAKLSGFAQIFYQGANDNALNSSHIDISEETSLASDPGALVSLLDLLLMSGQMSSGMRAVLVDHMNELPSDEAGRSQRVRDGITLIMASPSYLVQK